ncbi:unnamed protein product [Ceutorhynchus assimilis]|uniref:Odorant receptor n=1 Tax=Ceutorhynchus assimilis TaxID=467358 RepID=A0A9N9MKS9_9CUCU|nr:unnamed protein product [Ceutorhynchus assimilis]
MTIIEVKTYTDLDNLFPITSTALKIISTRAGYVYFLANSLLLICISVVLIIYGLHILNKQFWTEIGIIITIIVPVILQLAVNLLSYNVWKKWKIIHASQLSWNFNNISSKTKNRINLLCKRVKISFVCSGIVVGFATSAAQVDILPHISRFLQNLKFLATAERYVPFLRQIFLLSLVTTMLPMSLSLVLPLYYPYYIDALTKIQFYILQDDIEKFQKNMPPASDNNRHCYVKKNLRKIVKTHHKIWSLYCHYNREQFSLIGMTTFSLLLCIMFDTALLYSPYYSTAPPIINYMASLIMAFYFSGEGQAFEDLVDDITNSLYNLTWYDWNDENQKTFSTFFGLSRPFKLHGSMNAMIQINNALRMAYTLVNLARTISHK